MLKKQFFDKDSAAKELGCSPRTIQRRIIDLEIKPWKMGTHHARIMLTRADLDRIRETLSEGD